MPMRESSRMNAVLLLIVSCNGIPAGWATTDTQFSEFSRKTLKAVVFIQAFEGQSGQQADKSSKSKNLPPPQSPAQPPGSETASRPTSPTTVPRMSQELKKQPGPYLRSKLRVWTLVEAQKEFGEPIRHRVTHDDRGNPLADVWAYKHPGYVQVELAFDRGRQKLTDVYFYPVKLTWADAEKMYGSNYTTIRNKDGSTFRSYREAKTNLLVSQSDRVISIGIY